MKTLQTLTLILAALAACRAEAATAKVRLTGDSTLHPFGSTATTVAVDLERGEGRVKGLVVNIPVKSLKSGEAKLDKNLYAALKAEEHPAIVFNLTSYELVPGSVIATGSLTISGKSQEIQLQASSVEGRPGAYAGSKRLLMSDFGIKPPSLMMGMIKVHDTVMINYEVDLEGAP